MCCGTSFSWKTGKVDTGPIHAPDYYRWLQRNGRAIPRNPLDVPCGGMPNLRDVSSLCKRLCPPLDHVPEKIAKIHRLIIHIDRYEIPSYRYHTNDLGERENRDIRIKYMMNEIEEPKFRALLQQREKAKEKNRSIFNILSMIVMASTDIFQKMMRAKSRAELVTYIYELDELKKYSMESMQTISKRFKCVTPRIHDEWDNIFIQKSN
jgi:hypothetical protein